jgi:hypothetical protein
MPKPGLSEDEFTELCQLLVSGRPDYLAQSQRLSPRCSLDQVHEISLNTGLWYKDGLFYEPGDIETNQAFIAALSKHGQPIQHPDQPTIFKTIP